MRHLTHLTDFRVLIELKIHENFEHLEQFAKTEVTSSVVSIVSYTFQEDKSIILLECDYESGMKTLYQVK